MRFIGNSKLILLSTEDGLLSIGNAKKIVEGFEEEWQKDLGIYDHW